VHLDGARIFNAAVALGVDAADIAAYSDSVTFCLSKGLSAPVGSIVAGNADFITRARRKRKLVGGDMRQMGVLAAAGIVALEKMVDRLSEDHENAAMLANGLNNLHGLRVDLPPRPTNMVFCDLTSLGMTAADFQARMREEGVLCSVQGPMRVRLVTHRTIISEHIERTVDAVRTVLSADNPASKR
jgi:threonine aldolase